MARDLHDSTGQDLVALATTLSQLRASIPSSSRKLRKLASQSQALADQCIREVRTLSYLLHPPMLDEAGLEDAIGHYAGGPGKITLEISDKGSGISRNFRRQNGKLSLGLGVGIPSMHERVKLIGGELDIESSSSGTAVRVTIPVDD